MIKNVLLVMLIAFTAVNVTHAQQQKATPVNHGQNDPKATVVLDKVTKKYDSYKTIRATFTIRIEMPESNIDEVKAGKLFMKGDKFKLETDEIEVVSDNITRWIYLKDAREVQIKYNNNDEEDMSPSQLFQMYKQGFLYRLREEVKEGNRTLQVIELTPTDGKNKVTYHKVLLWVDKATDDIVKAKIFNANQINITYEFQKFVPNLDLNDSFFTFDPKKYPDIRDVTDLR